MTKNTVKAAKASTTKSKPIAASISKDVFAAASERATAEGMTVEQFIARTITDYVRSAGW